MKTISKEWLQKHYLELNWTRQMCADKRNVPVHIIDDLIRKHMLEKWRNGVTHKVHNKAVRSKSLNNQVKLNQPRRKMVEQWNKSGTKLIKVHESINSCAISLNLTREHIRDCLNPNKKRYRSGGYMFKEHIANRFEHKELLINKYNYEVKKIFEKVSA